MHKREHVNDHPPTPTVSNPAIKRCSLPDVWRYIGHHSSSTADVYSWLMQQCTAVRTGCCYYCFILALLRLLDAPVVLVSSRCSAWLIITARTVLMMHWQWHCSLITGITRSTSDCSDMWMTDHQRAGLNIFKLLFCLASDGSEN